MDVPLIARFTKFVLAGGVGFLVEAGIITWLVSGLNINIFHARAVSFSVAVTLTWAINRNFAFAGLQMKQKGREYSAYLLVQVVGAALNLVVFVIFIAVYPQFRATPVIPLATGAAVALSFNFGASGAWVFNDRNE